MRARRAGTPPRANHRRRISRDTWRGGGPARLATAVSFPTPRAARPGAQRRDTPQLHALRLSRIPELVIRWGRRPDGLNRILYTLLGTMLPPGRARTIVNRS